MNIINPCYVCQHRNSLSVPVKGYGWTCYLGESGLVLKSVTNESVDAVITDPPYGTGGFSVADRFKSTTEKYSLSDNPMPDFHGDTLHPDDWREMMKNVLRECYRVTKPTASALFFCDWRAYSSLMSIIGGAGFSLRGMLVWDKGRGSRPNKNGFRAQTELIIWARKGGAPSREPPVYLDGVFRHQTPKRVYHLTEKPIDLMRELVEIAPPGGVVLDPFQGSGTTGVAAILSGRQYIGIESTEHYHRVACDRLKNLSGAD